MRALFTQYQKFIVFLIVGGLTAVVYFSLFTLTWKWLNLDYKLALTISYFFAVSFQFITNRRVTFKSHDENIFYQALKFCGLLVINYLLTMVIVTWSVNRLALSPYLAILLSLMITVVTGFAISRLWVFKTVSPKMG
ncbi:MAG: GtrA family protein [Gammaproteobacteria bacterium]|nr:GtrA family protein [Gammaproteobacteria bacterium]